MSPYDVPEAVRGYYDDELQRFVIEFRYINNDEPVKKQRKENLTLRIGRHSNRLYGIEVDVQAIRGNTVSVSPFPQISGSVIDAIDSLSNSDNYDIARDAIEQNQDAIFASLTAA